MKASRKHSAHDTDEAEQLAREQEVQRANRELAAYFKGRRTEREARAALKIIKAFVRHRESLAPGSRRPLPGAQPARTGAAPAPVAKKSRQTAGKPRKRRAAGSSRKASLGAASTLEPSSASQE